MILTDEERKVLVGEEEGLNKDDSLFRMDVMQRLKEDALSVKVYKEVCPKCGCVDVDVDGKSYMSNPEHEMVCDRCEHHFTIEASWSIVDEEVYEEEEAELKPCKKCGEVMIQFNKEKDTCEGCEKTEEAEHKEEVNLMRIGGEVHPDFFKIYAKIMNNEKLSAEDNMKLQYTDLFLDEGGC